MANTHFTLNKVQKNYFPLLSAQDKVTLNSKCVGRGTKQCQILLQQKTF